MHINAFTIFMHAWAIFMHLVAQNSQIFLVSL